MFQANITLGAIQTGTTQKGEKYTTSRGSTLNKKDGSSRPVCVMAFGAQRDSVAKLLRKGKTVTVTAVWDGGVLKVIGPRREPAAAPAEAANG